MSAGKPLVAATGVLPDGFFLFRFALSLKKMEAATLMSLCCLDVTFVGRPMEEAEGNIQRVVS